HSRPITSPTIKSPAPPAWGRWDWSGRLAASPPILRPHQRVARDQPRNSFRRWPVSAGCGSGATDGSNPAPLNADASQPKVLTQPHAGGVFTSLPHLPRAGEELGSRRFLVGDTIREHIYFSIPWIGRHLCPDPVRKREFLTGVCQFNLRQYHATENSFVDVDVPIVALVRYEVSNLIKDIPVAHCAQH